MLEWISPFLEGASYFGLIRLLGAMSTTEIVFVFLCSKPLFVAAAFLVGFRAHTDRPKLETDN